MTIPPTIEPFWRSFCATAGEDRSDRFFEAFHFDDNAPSANALAALVLARVKRATSTMWASIARPAPRRRSAFGVRIDLTSACVGSSSFSAPQPSRTGPSQAVQNAMPGWRSLSRSSACTLSGGDSSCMSCRCSSSSAWISRRERSRRFSQETTSVALDFPFERAL